MKRMIAAMALACAFTLGARAQDVFNEIYHMAEQTANNKANTIDERKLHFKQDLDVRGMRGDEALTAVTYFIDDAILVGVQQVRILHGKGNGILRQLVRQYLSSVPNVIRYHDEDIRFGGPGITVAEF